MEEQIRALGGIAQAGPGAVAPQAGERGLVLITGGAGYIGSALVRRLLAAGYRVRVLDCLLYGDWAIRGALAASAFELVVGDMRDWEDVTRAITGVDAVIHLGAIVGDQACALDETFTIETNFEATYTIAAACRAAGVPRMLLASTCSVYGASDDILDERSSLNPVSLYAESKIAAEQVLLGLGDENFAPVVLRLATAYGEGHRPRFDLVVNLLSAKAIAEGQFTIFGGDQWRPFVHVNDIGLAFQLALEAPREVVAGEIFNVGSNDQNHRLSEVGEIVQELVPSATALTNDLITDRRNYHVRFDKIRDQLGFAPTRSLRDGILAIKAQLEDGTVLDYRDYRYNNSNSLAQILPEIRKPMDIALARTWHDARQAFQQISADDGTLPSAVVAGDD